jgi:hypothetical protein
LKASNKIFRSILTGFIGLFTCYQFIKRVDHEFAFDFIPLTFLSAIAIIVFIWTIFRDRKEYSKSKSIVDFIPTIIGTAIVLGLFLAFYILDQRDKSPSKLYCVTKIIDFNGASIDFREDGTYKLTSWCLGADYYRGKYIMQDSIITIDKSEIEKIIESSRFVIRPEIEVYEKDSIPGKDTVYQKSIYQINPEVIQNAIDFIVRDKK